MWTNLTESCQRNNVKQSVKDNWIPIIKSMCGTNITMSLKRFKFRNTFPEITSENEISLE